MDPTDLSPSRIRAALEGTRFRHVEVHDALASTQTLLTTDLGPDGRVVVADHQTSGRGRQQRTWTAPAGTSLLFSVLLRDVPPQRASLAGLAAAVAVARAIEAVRPELKWPNDVLAGGRKLCGILGELTHEPGVVALGIGVNVRQEADELPPGVEATSLVLEGHDVRRDDLLAAILLQLDVLVAGWSFMDEYRSRCSTIGRSVRVELGEGVVEGRADDVRDDGALVVDGRTIVAGDVVHVRGKEA